MSCLRAITRSQFSDTNAAIHREIAWILDYKAPHLCGLRVEHRLQFGDAMRAWVALIVGLMGCTDVLTERGRSPCAGEKTIDVAMPADDPAMQFQLERCQVDADVCPELCAIALEPNEIGSVVTGCHVGFRVDMAHIDVTYGCPLPTDTGSGAGGVK